MEEVDGLDEEREAGGAEVSHDWGVEDRVRGGKVVDGTGEGDAVACAGVGGTRVNTEPSRGRHGGVDVEWR